MVNQNGVVTDVTTTPHPSTTASIIASVAPHVTSALLQLTPSPFSLPPSPTTLSLRSTNSDPGTWLLNEGLTAKKECTLPVGLLGQYEISWILRLVPRLKELADLPVVLFISAKSEDYAGFLHLLRTSPLSVLHASSARQAAALSAVAVRHAHASSSPVCIWFDESPLSPAGSDAVPLAAAEVHSIAEFVRASYSAPALEMEKLFPLLPDFLGARGYKLTGAAHPTQYIVALAPSASAAVVLSKALPPHTALLTLTQLRPLPLPEAIVPSSAEKILVLEPYPQNAGERWGPIFLDVVSAVGRLGRDARCIAGTLGDVERDIGLGEVKLQILQAFSAQTGSRPRVGLSPSRTAANDAPSTKPVQPPKHESAYSNLLDQIFGSRLDLANAPGAVAPSTSGASLVPRTNPEYALGSVLAKLEKREELKRSIRTALASGVVAPCSETLGAWLEKPDAENIFLAAEEAAEALSTAPDGSALKRVYDLRGFFAKRSHWIVGSEAWSYDLGASGLHHALACGADVNLLLIDSTPFSTSLPASQRATKDSALYAMNYGEAYVASVAVYGDYAQTARALGEADAFPGPSIVVAYLPGGEREDSGALDVLKETKRGLDSGYWPLYRWNPRWEHVEGKESFQLDSSKLKESLKEFLERKNHLTLVAQREPSYAGPVGGGRRKELEDSARSRAKQAFEALAGAISGPPVLILYASDGGNAQKCATRLGSRAKARGLGAKVVCMDEYAFEDLTLEENVVWVTSTAGQGEFPQNGRAIWKRLCALPTSNGQTQPEGGQGKLSSIKFTVFGMGDSHYWPRPEDAHYYNKPGKDLFAKLVELGAEALTEIGLGDDQGADGYQTGYKEWEPRLWKAFGVEGVVVEEGAEGEPITNEHMKIASNYLRGTIKEGLEDKTTGAIAETDGQLTKFHGIYQQDDRDIRDDRKEAGLEPAYSFMVRCRLPAGVCRPDQWLAIDNCATTYGNQTFKLTTRQTFQFHGVVKSKLKLLIQGINKAMMDTIAACGDVNRTVMCSPNPDISGVHASVYQLAKNLSNHLLPRTTAYAEIWLDKKQVAGFKDEEPLYGPTYLPRKFKIAIAVPPHNDVDVHAHDLGYIAIIDGKEVVGYNVCVGGGMGVTHSNKATYPRLSDVLGFVNPDQAVDFAEKVLTTQRDYGNRKNRKNARVKYTVDTMGVEAFKAEVEKRLGWKLQRARPYKFESNIDTFGWTKGENGDEHFTMFIENGRVEDTPERPFKTGLREIAKVHKGLFRLTPNQHLILANVAPADKREISGLLKKYKLDVVDFSGLRLSSSACVAFPTCGLAMAESERYLPVLIDKIEEIMEENGLRRDELVMRMTGCPNGCARPWLAEVAFVGKAPGSYLMLLGGDRKGTRLNKPFREAVGEKEILSLMKPMIKSYALERKEGEGFGDFAIRKGWISATTHGTNFYDNMCPTTEIVA